MASVIEALEGQNIRPRIQQAWRSPAEQLEAFNSGHSKLKFGYHNATGKNGEKEALAVDLLDDDAPLNPSVRYLLAVFRADAAVAAAQGRYTHVYVERASGRPTPIPEAHRRLMETLQVRRG